jgi:hypothetical protein
MAPFEMEIAPRAWRVEFAEGLKALPDGVETIEIMEPRNVTALLAPFGTVGRAYAVRSTECRHIDTDLDAAEGQYAADDGTRR